MTSPYYSPSGRVPPAAIPVAILCSTAAIPAAWAYAWLTIHLNFAFNFFIAFGFAICIGLVVKYVATRAKVRNARWMGRAGIAIAVLAWYCQWAAWMAMTIHDRSVDPVGESLLRTFADLVIHPWSLINLATDMSRISTLTFAGWRVPGGLLITIWLIEAWIHLMLPTLLGRMRADEPFCETSGKWAEKIESGRKFAFIDAPEALTRVLEANPDRIFSVLAPWSERDSVNYSEVVIHACGSMDQYVTINNVVATVRGKNDVETTTEPVLEFLRLSNFAPDELIQRLTELADSPSATQESAPAPTPPELAAAVNYLESERYEAALDAAAPYIASNPSGLRADANRVCALACSGLGRWSDAVVHWQTLLDEELTAHNVLQLATSTVMAGDLQYGATLVDKARALNGTAGEMPDLLILTNFVTALTQAGQTAAAMPYLDDIRQAYVNLGLTDPTMLYVRGMPTFSAFLNESWPIVRAALNPTQWQSWYTAMVPHLDGRGNAELSEWLANRPNESIEQQPSR